LHFQKKKDKLIEHSSLSNGDFILRSYTQWKTTFPRFTEIYILAHWESGSLIGCASATAHPIPWWAQSPSRGLYPQIRHCSRFYFFSDKLQVSDCLL